MRKKPPRTGPHQHTDLMHAEISAQTPIIPERCEHVETGRKRILEARERVGQRAERELHNMPFPPEK